MIKGVTFSLIRAETWQFFGSDFFHVSLDNITGYNPCKFRYRIMRYLKLFQNFKDKKFVTKFFYLQIVTFQKKKICFRNDLRKVM